MSQRMLGDIAIDVAVEMPIDDGFPPEVLLPAFEPAVLQENLGICDPFCFNPNTGGLKVSVHTWIVRAGKQTILIDTCNGNHKDRPGFAMSHQLNLPYLEKLAAAGVHPAEVDVVMCTHLHVDHCGWNTRLENGKWVPTFKNAKYIFSKAEYDEWNPEDTRYAKNPINAGVFNDSVLPVIQAGQAQLIEGHHALSDHMLIEPAPGHTLGSMVLKVESKGRHALFAGDVLHSPMQILRPDWGSCFCDDTVMSGKTRRRLLEHCVEHDALLMPAHFPPPHAVRVQRTAAGYSFTPE